MHSRNPLVLDASLLPLTSDNSSNESLFFYRTATQQFRPSIIFLSNNTNLLSLANPRQQLTIKDLTEDALLTPPIVTNDKPQFSFANLMPPEKEMDLEQENNKSMIVESNLDNENENPDADINSSQPYSSDNKHTSKINKTCDSLLMRKDKHVIFIKINGTPVDKGEIIKN